MSWNEETLYYVLYLYVIENVCPETLTAETIAVSETIFNFYHRTVSTGAIKTQLYRLKKAINHFNDNTYGYYATMNMCCFVNIILHLNHTWNTNEDINFLRQMLHIDIDRFTV